MDEEIPFTEAELERLKFINSLLTVKSYTWSSPLPEYLPEGVLYIQKRCCPCPSLLVHPDNHFIPEE